MGNKKCNRIKMGITIYKIVFLLFSTFMCDCVNSMNFQLIPLVQLPYYTPSIPTWNQVKASVPRYPASTWPLNVAEQRSAQTYEDVNFSQDKTDQNVEGGTSVRLEGLNEDDIENRLNLGGLEGFAGQVAASAVVTVVGNAGVNLAGNFLNKCGNRGRRSILMHKIEKRQALESNKKDGHPNKEPEIANRIIPCPQDILGQGGNNGGRYCNNWSNGSNQGNNWSNSGHINCQRCNCRDGGCY